MYYIYVDEAGRGPLAGPVYVGICVEQVAKKRVLKKTSLQFPAMKKSLYKRCEDSKILSEVQRDSIYAELKQETLFQGTTAHISAKDIDRHGIVWALRRGVARALHAFFVGGRFSATSLLARIASQQNELCLVIDGPHDFGLRAMLGIEVIPVIDGDALIPMIGAASILAKVERDAYMKKIAKKHPGYGFEKHKGYGTRAHYEAINELGQCVEHRKTYIH